MAPKNTVSRHAILQAFELKRVRHHDDPTRGMLALGLNEPTSAIHAACFLLSKLPLGGALLCGSRRDATPILVGCIKRRLQEGARRVLVITERKSIWRWVGQLSSTGTVNLAKAESGSFDGQGTFVCDLSLAFSKVGTELIANGEPFDLCVIDDAHSCAALHTCYEKGDFRITGAGAMAGRLKAALRDTPCLIRTPSLATFSMAGLWSISAFLNQHSFLGPFPTFDSLYAELEEGTALRLPSRLASFAHVIASTKATVQLLEIAPAVAEAALRDDVQKLLVGHHDLFLGSTGARIRIASLALSQGTLATLEVMLERLLQRCTNLLDKDPRDELDLDALLRLLEQTLPELTEEHSHPDDLQHVEASQKTLRQLVVRTKALTGSDQALNTLMQLDFEQKKTVVVASNIEDIRQIGERLVEGSYAILLRHNEGPAANGALKLWEEQKAQHQLPRPLALREALIDDFVQRKEFLLTTHFHLADLNLPQCKRIVFLGSPCSLLDQAARLRFAQAHPNAAIEVLSGHSDSGLLSPEVLGDVDFCESHQTTHQSKLLELANTVNHTAKYSFGQNDLVEAYQIFRWRMEQLQLPVVKMQDASLERMQTVAQQRKAQLSHTLNPVSSEESFSAAVQRMLSTLDMLPEDVSLESHGGSQAVIAEVTHPDGVEEIIPLIYEANCYTDRNYEQVWDQACSLAAEQASLEDMRLACQAGYDVKLSFHRTQLENHLSRAHKDVQVQKEQKRARLQHQLTSAEQKRQRTIGKDARETVEKHIQELSHSISEIKEASLNHGEEAHIIDRMSGPSQVKVLYVEKI